MNTREISREQWVPFLDQFSEAHRGQRIEVRILNKATGDQIGAEQLPLVGITDDYKSSEGELIEVIAGDNPQEHVTHAISHPIHVRIAEREDGSPVAMQIESDDGSSTLVRFLPPMDETSRDMVGN